MKNYFSECNTLEEAKTLYKKLARENHPDMGGDLRTMQEINAQFSQFQARHATNEARERQKTAHAENRKSAADYHDLDEIEKQLFDVINLAVNLAGVEVELMGLWVWLTGNTKNIDREEIENLNIGHLSINQAIHILKYLQTQGE